MSITDDIDSITQELSDTQDNVSTLSDASNDQDNRLQSVETTVGDGSNIGQLQFPLNSDTVSYIKGVFPTGSVTLSSGSATVQDTNVLTSSTVIVCRSVLSGTAGNISYTQSAGSLTFLSSNIADNSTLVYVIF